MTKGINKVILIGNCGNDPETAVMPSGVSIANISIATSDTWKDKQTGEQQERTEWHRIVFYNRLAEIVELYVKKGAKIYIEGSLRTKRWQDKSGQNRYTTEIIASEMQMLDTKAVTQTLQNENITSISQNTKSPSTTTNQVTLESDGDDLPF